MALDMPFTLQLIMSWGAHPWYQGRLWLPESEWAAVGLLGNQIPFFSPRWHTEFQNLLLSGLLVFWLLNSICFL